MRVLVLEILSENQAGTSILMTVQIGYWEDHLRQHRSFPTANLCLSGAGLRFDQGLAICVCGWYIMGQISINPMAVLNEKDIEEGVLMFHSVYNHAVSVHQNTVVFRKGDCFEVVLTVATHA